MKILAPSWINRDPLLALIAALSLAGLLPYVYFDVHELIRHRRSSLIDERYTLVRRAVPASETFVGYASDLPADSAAWAKLHSQARYAIAPHILLEGDDARFVLVNVSDAGKTGHVCKTRGLRATFTPGQVVAIAAKAEKQQ